MSHGDCCIVNKGVLISGTVIPYTSVSGGIIYGDTYSV